MLFTVVLAVAVVAVPSVLFGVWHLVDGPGALGREAQLMTGVVASVALTLVALAVGLRRAEREAADLARPMADLADQAAAIGRRPGPSAALSTGVAEIDAVSEVLRQRAVELTRRLADEREFSSDASHQLRTPLTALLIRLEEISFSDDPETMRAEASSCIAQVERLTRVVDDLLRRSSSTAAAGRDAGTSLDSVLAGLQREWQSAFSRARRSIKISGERDLMVRARPDDLGQIISSVLENALEHGQGLVEIAARCSGPSVVLEMSDEGAGIDESLAPHVFERRVTTGGTGLGLALARDLAQANGGRLELLSARPARFALFLSAAPESEPDSMPG